LDVRNEPLVEVLEDISIAVNCQFNIDESWQDYPVTAAFYNEPLHRGLKKSFAMLIMPLFTTRTVPLKL
jgi:hypothetical protein